MYAIFYLNGCTGISRENNLFRICHRKVCEIFACGIYYLFHTQNYSYTIGTVCFFIHEFKKKKIPLLIINAYFHNNILIRWIWSVNKLWEVSRVSNSDPPYRYRLAWSDKNHWSGIWYWTKFLKVGSAPPLAVWVSLNQCCAFGSKMDPDAGPLRIWIHIQNSAGCEAGWTEVGRWAGLPAGPLFTGHMRVPKYWAIAGWGAGWAEAGRRAGLQAGPLLIGRHILHPGHREELNQQPRPGPLQQQEYR